MLNKLRKSKPIIFIKNYAAEIREFNDRSNVLTWMMLLLYKVALDIMFSTALKSSDATYNGEIDVTKYVIGSTLYLLIVFILPKIENNIISIFLNVEFIVTVAPIFCVLGYSGKSTLYAVYVWICMVLQIVLLRKQIFIKTRIKGIYIKGLQNYAIVAGVLLALFCISSYIAYNGSFAGLIAFNFRNTYTIRRSLSYPYILGYPFAWCYKIIVPFLMTYFMEKKKYGMATFMLGIELAFFMATGSKFILFVIPVVLGIYFLAKGKIVVLGTYIVFTICSMITVVISSLEVGALAVWINALFGSRFLTYPAILKFLHYDLFSEYPKVKFAEGLVGKAFSLTNLYRYSIGNSVSNYYRGIDINVQSNSGYLGESYAQAGFAGMLVMTLLLVMLISLLQKFSSNLKLTMIAPLLVVIVIVLNDGALFTTILTYGLAILMVLCACFNKPVAEEG